MGVEVMKGASGKSLKTYVNEEKIKIYNFLFQSEQNVLGCSNVFIEVFTGLTLDHCIGNLACLLALDSVLHNKKQMFLHSACGTAIPAEYPQMSTLFPRPVPSIYRNSLFLLSSSPQSYYLPLYLHSKVYYAGIVSL